MQQKLNIKKFWKIIQNNTLFILIFCSFSFGTNANKSNEISDWDARLQYARLLRNEQHYDQSLAEYRKLLNEKPLSVEVQKEMAEVLYYQGKRIQALQVLERIPSHQQDEKVRMLIGDISLALQDYPKAEGILRNHLESYQDDHEAKFKLAELLSWEKKYEESIRLYRQILAENPDDIQVRRKYAQVLMWMGRDEDAAEELKKTLKD